MNDLILKRANEIVVLHIDRAPNTLGAYLSPNSELDNILLVEPDSNCSTTFEVLPFGHADWGFKLIILSAEEWEMVKCGTNEMHLPNSWGDVKDFITLYEKETVE